MAGGLLVAFGFGYLAARSSNIGRGSGDRFQMNSSNGSDELSSEDGIRKFTAEKQWQETKARVIKHWKASPAARVDFELIEETMVVLERTPSPDLEKWMREFPVDGDDDYPAYLHDMILKVLARRGGGTFIRSLAENEKDDDYDIVSAIHYWIDNDPLAVMDWLDRNDLQKILMENIESYREEALLELSGKDVNEFERRLATVNPDTRQSVLEDYAYRRGTAENRLEILTRAASSPQGEAMALWMGLIRREAVDDPEHAAATLKDIKISDADRADLDDRFVVGLMNDFEFDGVVKDKSAAMQGWVERNPARQIPEKIMGAFGEWCRSNSGGATAWVEKQQTGIQYDYLADVVICQGAEEQEVKHHELAELAARITNQNIRAEVNRCLRESWQAKDSAAATEWERTLPNTDQERLGSVAPSN